MIQSKTPESLLMQNIAVRSRSWDWQIGILPDPDPVLRKLADGWLAACATGGEFRAKFRH